MSNAVNLTEDSETVRAVVGRYSDAYLTARAINGLGDLIKVIGIVIGVVIALPALLFAFKENGGVLIAFMGIAVAGYFATLFYLLGTLVAAQGQILKATLDTAVNTSAFLTADDRVTIMSLRRSAPIAGSSTASRVASAATWNCVCGRSNHWAAANCAACGAPATS